MVIIVLGKDNTFSLVGKDNDQLVELVNLFYKQVFNEQPSKKVLNAMRKVDRKQFLSVVKVDSKEMPFLENYDIKHPSELAYSDMAVGIGYGQTCSQPSMVAYMAKHLELKKGMQVFEIGTGCFYSGAITCELIGEEGYLVTIEYIKKLAELGKRNAIKYFGEEELENRVLLLHGDGKIGFPKKAPYDRIVATAGVADMESFDRSELESQLVPDGKILIPEARGKLYLFHYNNGKLVDREDLGGVAFVRLK